ncbi:ATP-grasp domain-containing protein [Brevibacillus ruminantium]|uniref:ATP-grasp domain-containing protein n=1 Tax=Brevibacillus ruminantium TaxID=2950604 RepID=A0ABY4WIG5_9BACL|nr:ATP-grasp domain-containing protein [Brevibacillus ruminantium]USG66586.1 ATP-grasp domain-containing protein [Brevibacillus ruminantium]
MKKKLLFIESNTTGTGMLALQKTKELGYDPVLFTNDPTRYQGLSDQACEVVVCDTNQPDGLQDSIKSRFSTEEIAGVTTTSEYYIYTVALLAEHFGWDGNPPATMKSCRNKAAVRTLLQGLPELYQPWFFPVDSLQEAEEKKGQLHFPCIVKPVDDSGSNQVVVCRSYEELRQRVKEILAVKQNVRQQPAAQVALVEEYVEGPEYSVEVFSYNGEHSIIGITDKSTGGEPYFIETGHIFPSLSTNELREIVEAGVLALLDKLKWRFGPCHLEIKIVDQKVFLVECNGRLAGGMIPELIRYATGMDVLKEQLKAAVGLSPDLSSRPFQYAGIRFLIPKEAGEIREVTGLEQLKQLPGVKEVVCRAQLGQVVPRVVNAYGRLGYMIAVAADEKELRHLLNQIDVVDIGMKERVTFAELSE